MFAKLVAILLAALLIAASLLVLRHRRLETAAEMAEAHRRLLRQESALWDLRHEIATRSRPEAVRELMNDLPHEWAPITRRDEPTLVLPAMDAQTAGLVIEPDEEDGHGG